MGFAVALDLGRLVETLPLGARLGIFAVDRLSGEGFDDRKHAAIGKIAVMSDGKHVAAGLVLVGCQPLPEVARIVAAERRHRDEGLDPTGLVAIVAEDDVAVQIVAAGI